MIIMSSDLACASYLLHPDPPTTGTLQVIINGVTNQGSSPYIQAAATVTTASTTFPLNTYFTDDSASGKTVNPI